MHNVRISRLIVRFTFLRFTFILARTLFILLITVRQSKTQPILPPPGYICLFSELLTIGLYCLYTMNSYSFDLLKCICKQTNPQRLVLKFLMTSLRSQFLVIFDGNAEISDFDQVWGNNAWIWWISLILNGCRCNALFLYCAHKLETRCKHPGGNFQTWYKCTVDKLSCSQALK